jgi:hypothetical protein
VVKPAAMLEAAAGIGVGSATAHVATSRHSASTTDAGESTAASTMAASESAAASTMAAGESTASTMAAAAPSTATATVDKREGAIMDDAHSVLEVRRTSRLR